MRNLFSEYRAQLPVEYCSRSLDVEIAGLPGEYAPPKGKLLLAMVVGQPVGCVGLRPFPREGACEMKRLYVRPGFRGGKIGQTTRGPGSAGGAQSWLFVSAAGHASADHAGRRWRCIGSWDFRKSPPIRWRRWKVCSTWNCGCRRSQSGWPRPPGCGCGRQTFRASSGLHLALSQPPRFRVTQK